MTEAADVAVVKSEIINDGVGHEECKYQDSVAISQITETGQSVRGVRKNSEECESSPCLEIQQQQLHRNLPDFDLTAQPVEMQTELF